MAGLNIIAKYRVAIFKMQKLRYSVLSIAIFIWKDEDVVET